MSQMSLIVIPRGRESIYAKNAEAFRPGANMKLARSGNGQTSKIGAHERNRTFDLTLTKGVLYRLSYGGVSKTY